MNLTVTIIPCVHEDLGPTGLVRSFRRPFVIELAKVRGIAFRRLKGWMIVNLHNLDLIGMLGIECLLKAEFEVVNPMSPFHPFAAIIDGTAQLEES